MASWTKTHQARNAQAVADSISLATTAVTTPTSSYPICGFLCAHATSFLFHSSTLSPEAPLVNSPPPCLLLHACPFRTEHSGRPTERPPNVQRSDSNTARDVKSNLDPRFSRPPGREARSLPCIITARIQERAARRLLVTGRPTRSWVLTRDRPCWRSLFGTSHLHSRYRSVEGKRLSASPRA